MMKMEVSIVDGEKYAEDSGPRIEKYRDLSKPGVVNKLNPPKDFDPDNPYIVAEGIIGEHRAIVTSEGMKLRPDQWQDVLDLIKIPTFEREGKVARAGNEADGIWGVGEPPIVVKELPSKVILSYGDLYQEYSVHPKRRIKEVLDKEEMFQKKYPFVSIRAATVYGVLTVGDRYY